MQYILPVLPLRRTMLSGATMSDLVADRIERALKRIEAAAASQAHAKARLERRNETLRGRIESAIGELDVLIERENENALPVAGDAEDEG
jgi:hypothetical protein